MQAVASGKTQADAYRSSFNATKMKAESVQQCASRLMANVKVAARVDALRSALADKHLWTREDSVKALRAVADKDDAKGGEIVAAIKELNSMHGFNAPIKVEVDASVVTRIELVAMRGNA